MTDVPFNLGPSSFPAIDDDDPGATQVLGMDAPPRRCEGSTANIAHNAADAIPLNLGPAGRHDRNDDEDDDGHPDADSGRFAPRFPENAVKPAAVGLAALLLVGGVIAGVRVITATNHAAPTIQQPTQADNERRQAELLHDAMTVAKALLERIRRSPIADRIDPSQLEQAMDDQDIERMEELTKQLETSYATTLDDTTSQTSKTLGEAIGRADKLRKAPESDEHARLNQLADTWRGKTVTEENLADAIAVVKQITGLAATVESQQAKAEEAERQRNQREQEERERQSAQQQSTQQQATEPTQPQQPQYQPPTPQPAPSWNVPGQQTERLPNRDGSL
ncbi:MULTISPECIES: hypothetical protein [Bifidobacterium]|uniref:Uncharacterized protein n=1 Tax=Bifidobacterium oedipodis TaxID=2675322 RepID=A0A7Y0ENF9_9BIFI|nr:MULTISPECIES: hypothetical protein [Bifidobacterium]MBW3079032.1 hypothetical protein [Bifidobacterium simiiventris]NMM93397.1 hypothetical protein [Bifidobacterium sp. DSM 109957]